MDLIDPTGNQSVPILDREGIWMLLWYLYGGGKTVRIDSGHTNTQNRLQTQMVQNYMMRDPDLAGQVAARLGEAVAAIWKSPAGSTKRFYFQDAALIGGDERGIPNFTGAGQLHYANPEVGGFQIWVVATKMRNGDIQLRGTCKWNDLMDPDFNVWYDLPGWLFGKILSATRSRDYEIHISWNFNAVYGGLPSSKAHQGRPNRGWPYVLPSAIVPPGQVPKTSGPRSPDRINFNFSPF